MWKFRNLDKQLFMGAAAKIHEFLDIEQLMPPERLRLSKLLGRPLMRHIDCNCLEKEFLNNLQDIDCTVAGEYGDRLYAAIENRYWQRLRVWSGHVSSAPRDLVGVMIISDEDLDFGRKWYATYRNIWPFVETGEDPNVHHAFENLHSVYLQHVVRNSRNWNDVLIRRRHAAGLDGGIWHSSAEWLCCICGIDNEKRITYDEEADEEESDAEDSDYEFD
jgi:hypothetical protein